MMGRILIILTFVLALIAGAAGAAQQTIEAGETMGVNRARLNSNFSELYSQAATKWVSGTTYTANNNAIVHGGNIYVCKSSHTAGATTEPGVGADWDTVWTFWGGSMTYPGAGIPLSTGSAWDTSYSLTSLAAALDGEDWAFTGAVDVTGASSFSVGPLTFADSDSSPSTVGNLTYDNTVAGLDDGALAWYDDDEVKYLADYATLPTTGGQALVYDATSDKWVPTAVSTEIASGTAALRTAEIATGACATVVTVTATGVATTDVIDWSFDGDPTSVTGYNPAGDLLYVVDYPTADAANFKVCNKSGSAVTPGAITLNWRVDR